MLTCPWCLTITCVVSPQITAEQILRESRELQEQGFKPPTQKITDPTELAEYRLRKRKEYEDLVRRVRWNGSIWVKVSTTFCTCELFCSPTPVRLCSFDNEVIEKLSLQALVRVSGPAQLNQPCSQG